MKTCLPTAWKSLTHFCLGTPVRHGRARPTLETLEDRLPLAADPLGLSSVLPQGLMDNVPPGLSEFINQTYADVGNQPQVPPANEIPGTPGNETPPLNNFPSDPFIPPGGGTNPNQPTQPTNPTPDGFSGSNGGSNDPFLIVQASQNTSPTFRFGTTSAPAADATLTRFALLSTERNALNGPSTALASELVGRETPNDPFLPQGQGNGLVRFDFLGLGSSEEEEEGVISGATEDGLGGQIVILEVLRDNAWTVHSVTTTDSSGHFAFTDVLDGTYRVRIESGEAPVLINATMPEIRIEAETPKVDTTGQGEPDAETPSWAVFVLAGTVVCWPLSSPGKGRDERHRPWHYNARW